VAEPAAVDSARDILTRMNQDTGSITSTYFVVKSGSVQDLINDVSKFMTVGWKPVGGVAALVHGGTAVFLQAITSPSTHI
jgi:hypothetical protein